MDCRYTQYADAVFFLKYHLVWCPKFRRPALVDAVTGRLRALLAEKAAELGMTIHALEVRPDHVHLFVESDPTRCGAEIVNRLKGFTSRALRDEFLRLFTNGNQERELAGMLETHRRLYNACLEERKTAYETDKTTIKYPAQSARFKAERATNPFYARLNFSSAQAIMRRLDKAFQAFFRRVKASEAPGYPRFKGRDRFDSIEFPAHGDGIRLNGNRPRIQHVGTIQVKVHREIVGTIKTATLKREADKWYVVLSCDLGDVQVPASDKPPVGIDVGLEAFLTTSDGEQEPNPRYLKDALPDLHRKGRAVSRKRKGGKNRRKAVKRLKKVHARVKDLRKEHHHQVALKLVRRYGLIAIEGLNIKGMLKNDRLARSISDAGWSGFLPTLKCKAKSAGASVVEVDARGTSQRCSRCGADVSKGLSDRWHECPFYGLSLHRDENSAKENPSSGSPGPDQASGR